jgi:hypothetical protein
MTKRELRIVQESPMLGICEYCNAQFRADDGDIQQQFESHKCRPQDFAQNARHIVREATDK